MKSLIRAIGTLGKNTKIHFAHIFTGQEPVGQGLLGILRDIQKLARLAIPKAEKVDTKRAKHYLNKGRQAYNQKRYENAEQAFREAILADSNCAMAYTYLGHTLYKMGRFREAIVYWGKAVDIAPGSEAARKAQEKIAMMQQKRNEAGAWIEDRLGDA